MKLLPIVFLAACHQTILLPRSSPPIVFAFAGTFSPEFQNTVIDAFDYWNLVLGRTAFIPGTFEKDIPRIAIKIQSLQGVAGRTFRLTRGPEFLVAEIHISSRWASSPEAETIVRHEIGHVLGLPDTVLVGTLMYHSVEEGTDPEPTEEQVAVLR